jgi:phosphonoacetaldehyde hydrolase
VAPDSVAPYRGPVQAVILDWAGTTVDYGSLAPVDAFVALFARYGIEISADEARGPMGAHKRDHIAQLLQHPRIALAWREALEREPTEGDIDRLYSDLTPLQIEALRRHADIIPGTLDAVRELRERDVKIGSDTGYNRAMMDVLASEARRRGYAPDVTMTADDVPAGRPHPWMAYQNMIALQVYPAAACVKVGDTAADVLEGRNAGMWAVAITRTGNEIGLSEQEVAALHAETLRKMLNEARDRLAVAGAHVVIESISDLPAVVRELESRLAAGEAP